MAEAQNQAEDNKMEQEEEEPVSKTLFCSNISWRIKRSFLKKKASEFGNVTDCKIINYFDKTQNRVKSKGYGFVTFETEEEAIKAKKEMDGMEFQARELVVKFATSSGPRMTERTTKKYNEGDEQKPKDPGMFKSLFIKAFPRETTVEEITKMLTDMKFPEPASVLARPLRSSGRQYAIVKFETHEDAKMVLDSVSQEGQELMNDDKPLIVEVCEDRPATKKRKSREQGKKTAGEAGDKSQDDGEPRLRRLYMKGMSEKTTEESLQKKCEEYGVVEKCQVKMSKKPENPTKFAYVNYETPEQAKKALEEMNEMEFEEGTLTVEYAKGPVRRRGSRKGRNQEEAGDDDSPVKAEAEAED